MEGGISTICRTISGDCGKGRSTLDNSNTCVGIG